MQRKISHKISESVCHIYNNRTDFFSPKKSASRQFLNIFLVFLFGGAATAGANPSQPPPSNGGGTNLKFSIMSYNIRFGSAKDGKNNWTNRRPLLCRLLRMQYPDIIGTQEGLRFQLDEIRRDLSQYGEIGAGRDDGAKSGEYCAILYRTDRFVDAQSGTFWLSSTPEIPGSKSWGNRFPRICTWALLVDKSTRKGVYVYNLHLDNLSQESRRKGIELLESKIANHEREYPVVILGDFNVTEGNPVVRFLKGSGWGKPGGRMAFIDAYRKIHPKSFGGTFNFFRGIKFGPRIDYIFSSPDASVENAEIVKTGFNGCFPSDHFPLLVHLTYPG
jgi:endonuclease/exonuclease/phosphatase family metal-dependent hydrolase